VNSLAQYNPVASNEEKNYAHGWRGKPTDKEIEFDLGSVWQ
jgi:hypothetical protein